MKALILVGGFGTRLRPLTLTVPKPLVEFANVPILCHQIEAFAKVGVKEVILAINFQPEKMLAALESMEQKYGVKITCSKEEVPMGTGGPLRLAKELIEKDNEEGLFFVSNSDVICEYPLEDMIRFHKNHGREGSIFVTQVEDPSKYGVVVSDEDGLIKKFVEKPKNYVSNKINAGIYLFKTSMISRIEERPTSIERETFPQMAEAGELYSFLLEGFWMDIGQPKDFLTGIQLYLEAQVKKPDNGLAQGPNIIGNVIIDPRASVSEKALIGPNVVIGPGAVIEAGVRIANCAIMENVTVKAHTWVKGSIIGWGSTLGSWVRVEGLTVVAEDVQISDEIYINASYILPHKGVSTSLTDPGTIVM